MPSSTIQQRSQTNTMPKRQNHSAFKDYLISITNLLVQLTEDDLRNSSESLQSILRNATQSLSQDGTMTLDDFIQRGRRITGDRTPCRDALDKLKIMVQTHQKASHWEKRRLAHELFRSTPYSVLDRCAESSTNPFNIQTGAGSIEICYRQRCQKPPFGSQKYMVEVEGDPTLPRNQPFQLVTEDQGFLIVPVNKSVVFIGDGPDGKPRIELVVIRNIALDLSITDSLFAWLKKVVDVACHERRNIRPNHPGHMAQVGLNMGPRHARVLGWAKSFTKNLDNETQILHDEEVIGASALCWNLIKTYVPSEVLGHVMDRWNAVDLPSLGTRNVEAGSGFKVTLDGKQFSFGEAERSPPEIYLARGYSAWSHTDPAFCDYAFSFCVARDLVSPPTSSQPLLPGLLTRSATQSKAGSNALPSSQYVQGGGGNFVDVGLKVVVKAAPGTLFVFQPIHLHGTTVPSLATNWNIAITFSRRLADAYAELKQDGDSIVSGEGAGEGNRV